MNIFEELAESYTYNGVVSLKALDDDIVTLENQIDSYNATLRELQLRGKKVGPLVAKIRDAKIRLSLLKAVYKKESDKATPDDVILNMLGVSANNAKEVNSVNTAADGREPKPQNFESAELEEIVEETPGVDVKAPESEKVVDNEIVITEEDEADMQASVIEDNTSDDEIIVVDENAPEEELKELYSSLTSEDEVIVVRPEVLAKVKQEQERDADVTGIKTESICKEVDLINVPAFQIPVEKETKSVDTEKVAKEKETKPVKAEKKSIVSAIKKIVKKENKPTEITDIVLPKTSDVYLKPDVDVNTFVEAEDKVVDNTEFEAVPPPTIDDYYETEPGSLCETVSYDEDGVVCNYEEPQELPEIQEVNAENTTACDVSGEVVLNETQEECKEVKTYDAFYWPDNKIYVSFDLCGYTDMVNTNSITGTFNEKHKVIELNFSDMRDYPLFTFFVDERNRKCRFFDRFIKKPRSIIMYVRTELDGKEKEYRYEFTGCRLVEVFDSDYKSMRDSAYYPTATHEFYAKFKYKRLKMS